MKHIKGIVFDLDGTLVTSSLNFSLIREEIGCPDSDDILSYMERLPPQERQNAAEIVYRHEIADAETSVWLPHARTFVEACEKRGIPMAIVTRNSAFPTALKVKKNDIPIQHVISRENHRPKPDPSALLGIADQFRLAPSSLMMVGDYKYDLLAGRNANFYTCLVNFEEAPEYADLADYRFAHFGLLRDAFFS